MSDWVLARRIDAVEARLARLESASIAVAERARDEAAVIAVCEMRWPDFGASDGAERMATVREQLRLGDEQTRRQYQAVRRAISRCVP